METAHIGTIIGTWLAGFLTLAILSFLYKDNPFYKFAEHLYVGVSAGYWVIYVWGFDVWPMLVGGFQRETGFEKWILLVPGALGVIMLSRWFPRTAWLSRWSIAFTVGVGAGLGVTGNLQGFVVPQIEATLLPISGFNVVSVNNLILVVGVISTILYFYFSKPHKGVLGGAARVGIVFIMISFGASFGYTLMARISLLIGRLHFLLSDLLHLVK
ncbi:MAG: hypothetical protein FJY74_07640 [Candidatus Eisenbacteria bacterium]|nr:hypothetical protein [Candidatus Eisenbacteria bacterium]